MCDDDLDINPFYKSLQNIHKKKYSEAKRRSWIICIPVTKSIKHLKNFSQRFVDCHLLKTSPYFQSQYVSTDARETHNFEIENGFIVAINDGTKGNKFKILTEELGYDYDFKQFKILIIDKPLESTYQATDLKDEDSNSVIVHSFEECKAFLYSYKEHAITMSALQAKLQQFERNYYVLPDYLYDAACKLKDIVDWVLEELLLSHNPRLRSDEKLANEISYAVDNYVIGYVYRKLYDVIVEKFSKNNVIFLKNLKEIKIDELNIEKQFICPLQKTASILQNISKFKTPGSKIKCLNETLNMIGTEVQNNYKKLSTAHDVGAAHLTSDDMIPLLVKVLYQVQPISIESDLYFIENFQWNLTNKDKQSFCLVTFKAAVEFVKNFHQESNQAVDLDPQSTDKDASKYEASNIDSNTRSRYHPVDRDLANITRMLEVSTRELKNVSSPQFKPTPKKLREPDKESLGEFLSSLQQNSLGFSYGKQS